jgi:hypothetical protein
MRAFKFLLNKKPRTNRPRRRAIRVGRLLPVGGESCRCIEVTVRGYVMASVDDPTKTFLLTLEEFDLIGGQHSFRF